MNCTKINFIIIFISMLVVITFVPAAFAQKASNQFVHYNDISIEEYCEYRGWDCGKPGKPANGSQLSSWLEYRRNMPSRNGTITFYEYLELNGLKKQVYGRESKEYLGYLKYQESQRIKSKPPKEEGFKEIDFGFSSDTNFFLTFFLKAILPVMSITWLIIWRLSKESIVIVTLWIIVGTAIALLILYIIAKIILAIFFAVFLVVFVILLFVYIS